MVPFNGAALIRGLLICLVLLALAVLADLMIQNKAADDRRRRADRVEELLDDWHPEARGFGWNSLGGEPE